MTKGEQTTREIVEKRFLFWVHSILQDYYVDAEAFQSDVELPSAVKLMFDEIEAFARSEAMERAAKVAEAAASDALQRQQHAQTAKRGLDASFCHTEMVIARDIAAAIRTEAGDAE